MHDTSLVNDKVRTSHAGDGITPVASILDILYLKLSISVTSGGAIFGFTHDSGVVKDNNDANTFLMNLLDSELPSKLYAPKWPKYNINPLDVGVARSSYLVFHLDDGWNWRFSPDKSALDLESPSATYGDIYYAFFDGNDDHYIGTTPPSDNDVCNIICIGIDDLDNLDPDDYDHFKLNVEFIQSAPDIEKHLPLIIDPDIKNTGGNPLSWLYKHKININFT